MKTPPRPLIIVLFTLLTLAGCGYHNPYVTNLGQEQPVALIYLTTWDNRTNELGLEGLILQKTADWLQQSRHLRLAIDKEQADYLLSGKIMSVNYPATAFSVTDVATTLQAEVKVSYRLTEQATGKLTWDAGEVGRGTSYPAGNDAVRSQSNKKNALAIIANELAEQIYIMLTATLTSDSEQ